MKSIFSKLNRPIVILLAVLTFLCGCSQPVEPTTDSLPQNTDEIIQNGTTSQNADQIDKNDNQPKLTYDIIEINGQYYLNFNNYSKEQGTTTNGFALDFIEFSSISELKSTIKSGTLQGWQLDIIKESFPKDDTNGIKICNINNLYRPILPTSMKNTSVAWMGENYTFVIESEIANGDFHYHTKEQYDGRYKKNYSDRLSSSSVTVKNEGTTSERNATIYDISTSAGDFQFIRYSLSTASKTLVVDEIYRLRMNDESLATSANTPYFITIYGIENGVHFVVELSELEERPSVEWLMSFGIKEYVPTEIK